MAIAVIGGLVTSTGLTLVMVPAAFTWIDDLERWLGRKIGHRLDQHPQPGIPGGTGLSGALQRAHLPGETLPDGATSGAREPCTGPGRAGRPRTMRRGYAVRGGVGTRACADGGLRRRTQLQPPAAPKTQGYTADALAQRTVATAVSGGEASTLQFGGMLPGQWWTLFGSKSSTR